MNSHHTHSFLPHHRLLAYGVAVELLEAVLAARISDRKLRDEAERAAKGTCLNVAEGAGRSSRADKARVYAIARGECVESIAAVEIAVLCGRARADALPKVIAIGNQLNAMLTKLIR
jgi:four helix bundle protein